MSREWDERNDVAVISWQSKTGRHGGSGIALRCSESYSETHWRTQTFGCIADDIVTNVRPLLVIDPEDRPTVVRLMNTFWDQRDRGTPAADFGANEMQSALRSLLTPPKPEEPMGLGAVVEDATGERWIRAARINHGWHRPMGTWAAYEDIDAVRVLSEEVATDV